MNLFWNFLQDHRYFKERKRSDVLAIRVQQLEKEMADQRDLMTKLLHALETRLNDDLDGDGQMGKPTSNTIKIRQTRDNKNTRKQIEKQRLMTR